MRLELTRIKRVIDLNRTIQRMDTDIPARVQQFGLDAHRAGMARSENPYVEFGDLQDESAVGDAVAQILMNAWWRG